MKVVLRAFSLSAFGCALAVLVPGQLGDPLYRKGQGTQMNPTVSGDLKTVVSEDYGWGSVPRTAVVSKAPEYNPDRIIEIAPMGISTTIIAPLGEGLLDLWSLDNE